MSQAGGIVDNTVGAAVNGDVNGVIQAGTQGAGNMIGGDVGQTV